MSFYFPIPKTEVKSKQVYDCSKCKLRNNVKTPEMEPYIGNAYNGLVILGQSPTKVDDLKGIPFEDSLSTVLRSNAAKQGINLAKTSAMLFASSCYQKKHSETHFKCCRNKLAERLIDLKPKLIICCGEYAFKYLFNLKEKHSITKLRNRFIPNYEFNCIVFPVFDPYDYKMYKRDKKTGKLTTDMDNYYSHTYKWDLERVFKAWKNKFSKRSEVNKLLLERRILENISIKEVTTFKEAQTVFKFLNSLEEVCVDYETTSLKPYDDNFSIVYMAFSTDKESWVFHEDFWLKNQINKKYLFQQVKSLLENNNILKVIQNAKYEDLCSRYVFGIKQINNVFCTMIATHIIDERQGTKSQDFQNLVRFGIPPYNDKIKKYLITDKKNDEDGLNDDGEIETTYQKQNRIREAPKSDMIQYNGLDTITCMNNYKVITETLMNQYDKQWDCYDFFSEGHWLFANMSQRGVPVSTDELSSFKSLILNKLNETEEKIKNLAEVQEYNEHLLEITKKEKPKTKADKVLKELLHKPRRRLV